MPDAAAADPAPSPWPFSATTVCGVVEAANHHGTGVKVDGAWWNIPRGYPYPLPDRGAVVALEPAGAGRTFRRLATLVPPPSPSDRAHRIARQAALKAVSAFVASRAALRVGDVERLHVAALAWIERADSAAAPPDEDGRIARQVALQAAAAYLAQRPERPEADLFRCADRFELLAAGGAAEGVPEAPHAG